MTDYCDECDCELGPDEIVVCDECFEEQVQKQEEEAHANPN